MGARWSLSIVPPGLFTAETGMGDPFLLNTASNFFSDSKQSANFQMEWPWGSGRIITYSPVISNERGFDQAILDTMPVEYSVTANRQKANVYLSGMTYLDKEQYHDPGVGPGYAGYPALPRYEDDSWLWRVKEQKKARLRMNMPRLSAAVGRGR
jgi:hypothetical protein